MAVAHDNATESHTGTTGSASQASFTWTHAPVGTPAGILVFVFTNANSDFITSVDWGGVTLTQFSEAIDTATEPGRMTAFFNGNASALAGRSGNVVTVTRTNNATVMYASAVTVTSTNSWNTATGTPVLVQDDGTLAEQSTDDGSPGTNSVRYASAYSGLAAPPSAGASSTSLTSIDFGNNGCAMVRETTAGQGSRNVGFSSGTSDDRAVIHVAIKEVNPVQTKALTATLSFTSAQTKKVKDTQTATLSFSGANTRVTKKRQTLTGALSFATVGPQRTPKFPGALVLSSGFESAQLNEATFGTVSGGTIAASTTFAKSGTYSCRINRTSAAAVNLRHRPTGDPVGGSTTGSSKQVCASWWVRFATLPTTNTEIGRLTAYSTTSGGIVFVDSSGNLTVKVAAGTASGTIATLSTGVWYQIELAVDNSASTGKAKVRVNGGTSTEVTGSITVYPRPDICLDLGSLDGTGGTYDMYVDDITVWTGYSYPGQVTLRTIRPDTDIDANWSIFGGGGSRWASIDDLPLDVNTGMESSTANQTQTIGHATVTVPGTIMGLTHYVEKYNSGGKNNNYLMEFTDGSGNVAGPSVLVYTGGSGGSAPLSISKSPTGGTLTQADVDAIRTRYTHDSSSNAMRVTDAWTYIATNPNVAQALTAALSFTSTQTKKGKRLLTATLSFTSAQTRKAKRASTAALSFTSAQTRKAKRASTATLSFTSAQTRKMKKSVAGALSFTSAQTKKVKAVKAATLSFTSTQTRKAKKLLTAALSFTGAMATSVIGGGPIPKALTATLSFTSAQLKKVKTTDSATLSFTSAQTRKAKRASTAALSFTSAQTRRGKKFLTASWSATGAMTKRTAFRKALTGALSFTSAQTKKTKKTLTGATLSFTTSTQKLVRRGYAAAGSFTGSLTKRVRLILAATLNFSGSNSTNTISVEPPFEGKGGWYLRWHRKRREN